MIEVCQHCFQLENCIEVGRIFLCDEHKELKQYQPKEKKVHKIKPRARRRVKQESEYTKAKKEYLEEHPDCECCIREQNEIINPATTIHHKKGRIESLLCDKTYFLAACFDCHEFIEKNPEWAKQNGYSLSRLQK